jgi:hypothetical protein
MVHQAGTYWLVEGPLVETVPDGERVFDGGLGVEVRESGREGRDGGVGEASDRLLQPQAYG